MRQCFRGPVFYTVRIGFGLPIETAWASVAPDGGIVSKAHLIRPDAIGVSVDEPDDTANGISFAKLMREGEDAFAVAFRMHMALRDRALFSVGTFDAVWLKQLFEIAALTPRFAQGGMAEELTARFMRARGLSREKLHAAIAQAQRDVMPMAGAEAQVRFWAHVWQLLNHRAGAA